jgi:hypothetical protein
MSTYDEVQLHAPLGTMDNPRWQAFGDVEPFLLGDPVNYVHSQRLFRCPEPVAFPAAYGRIGSRVLAIMLSRPEARFFVVNAGGHVSYLPVQNPARDFELRLPDYEPGRPFGLRGRLIYKPWEGAEEIVARYKEWARR